MTLNQFVELAVSLSVQATLVIGVVWLLTRLARNGESECRLWSSSYVVILLLVALGLSVPHVRAIQPWSSLSSGMAARLVTAEILLGRVLLMVWLLGTSASAFWFLVAAIETARFLKTCSPADDTISDVGTLLEKGSDWDVAPGLCPQILTSAAISGPCCWQFHRPYVVLPEYLFQMDRQHLRFVLRHEVAHLRLRHPLQLFLERLVAILFWFHPIVRWACRQSATARELACDEAALDSHAATRDYLRTLLAIAECGAASDDRTPASLAFGRSPHLIALRARRLMQNAAKPYGPRRQLASWLTTVGLAATAVLISLVWVPADILASPRSHWSPWPRWSSCVLHDFGVCAPDYEVYDGRFQLHELLVESSDRRQP